MNAVCLVVDGWHAGFLGCYGNSWIVTPEIDRLAGDGFVFDQALIDSPMLDARYRAYWHGRHALAGDAADAGASLASRLSDAGARTALLTDDPAVPAFVGADDFTEAVLLPACEPAVAADVEETRLAQLIAAACDWLSTAPQPFLLWIHAAGMTGPWDAPLELRRRYADEDAAVYEGVMPPAHLLADDFDPDERLAVRWAYAGQVSVLDQCIGALAAFLDSADLASSTLLSLTSTRGYPLGEHRRIGLPEGDPSNSAPTLYEEMVHVPWIVRAPGIVGGARSQALVQPADLGATIAYWFGHPYEPAWSRGSVLPILREELDSLRDRACILGGHGERAVRTAAWHLRWTEGGTPELFGKPDDRWEVNDVADRCGDLIEPLQQTFAAAELAITTCESPSTLPDELIVGPD